MKTTVVNLKKEPYDVYCGRAGHGKDGYFGNPFHIINGIRGSAIEPYKEYFYKRLETDPDFKERILALKGKVLGCFCKPRVCHCDIIANYLNNLETKS
jgi:hypothetical protein